MKILIIAFLREENVLKIIESAFRNGVDEIYIAIDGYRNTKEKLIQDKLIEKLNYMKESGKRIKIWKRDLNLGVAVSVITAIDWFFKYENQGLIFEDDLEVGDEFYQYSELIFKEFRNNPKILMFTGNRFTTEYNPQKINFCNYPQIWGWGTWNTKWLQMRELITRKHRISCKDFLSKNKLFFFIGSKRVMNSLIDTWDIPLAYEFLKQNYLCIIPPTNLISNIGNDSFSEHTKSDSFPLKFQIGKLDMANFHISDAIPTEILIENKFLEDKVFRIKLRHHFLIFYAPISTFIRSVKFKKFHKKLLIRLADVKIP